MLFAFWFSSSLDLVEAWGWDSDGDKQRASVSSQKEAFIEQLIYS